MKCSAFRRTIPQLLTSNHPLHFVASTVIYLLIPGLPCTASLYHDLFTTYIMRSTYVNVFLAMCHDMLFFAISP
jgi:hypothetical protein